MSQSLVLRGLALCNISLSAHFRRADHNCHVSGVDSDFVIEGHIFKLPGEHVVTRSALAGLGFDVQPSD